MRLVSPARPTIQMRRHLRRGRYETLALDSGSDRFSCPGLLSAEARARFGLGHTIYFRRGNRSVARDQLVRGHAEGTGEFSHLSRGDEPQSQRVAAISDGVYG